MDLHEEELGMEEGKRIFIGLSCFFVLTCV